METVALDFSDFKTVIGIVLNNWTGFKMAVEHGTGGNASETKRKIENLIESIDSLLINKGDYYDVVDWVEAFLDDEFQTLVEDGSSEQVALELTTLHRLLLDGNSVDVSLRIGSMKTHRSILEPSDQLCSRAARTTVSRQDPMDRPHPDVDQSMDQDPEWTVVERRKR